MHFFYWWVFSFSFCLFLHIISRYPCLLLVDALFLDILIVYVGNINKIGLWEDLIFRIFFIYCYLLTNWFYRGVTFFFLWNLQLIILTILSIFTLLFSIFFFFFNFYHWNFDFHVFTEPSLNGSKAVQESWVGAFDKVHIGAFEYNVEIGSIVTNQRAINGYTIAIIDRIGISLVLI